MAQVRDFSVDRLKVGIFEDRSRLGQAAATAVADRMRTSLKTKARLFMVFASAPSQNEFLDELAKSPGIDWKRVTAFHLDEYVGLSDTAPQNFGNFLRMRLFDRVSPGTVHYLDGMAEDLDAECVRYSTLLEYNPFDIACIGIGENGHIAFNDPPFARFDDPQLVKIVDLDPVSRQQQVHDGCFQELDAVPKKAFTLTIPAIFSARFIYCMVPGSSKADAVKNTLEGPVSTACPATILRKHDNAVLFLDSDSAGKLKIWQ
jgi:glucosamine-6-phosphate deaminase